MSGLVTRAWPTDTSANRLMARPGRLEIVSLPFAKREPSCRHIQRQRCPLLVFHRVNHVTRYQPGVREALDCYCLQSFSEQTRRWPHCAGRKAKSAFWVSRPTVKRQLSRGQEATQRAAVPTTTWPGRAVADASSAKHRFREARTRGLAGGSRAPFTQCPCRRALNHSLRHPGAVPGFRKNSFPAGRKASLAGILASTLQNR